MVTRLTSYTKQRYVLNSADDPGDIEFHNGDIVYQMDVRQEIIFSEEDNQWYPVPTGGGGGGGVTVTPLSIAENGTYTAPSGTAYSPVTVNVAGLPQGIVDYTINYTDIASGCTWSCAVANNGISNLTTDSSGMSVIMPFRYPIAIATNDVIEVTVSNRTTGFFANIFLVPVVYVYTKLSQSVAIATNVSIANQTYSLTYTGDPIVVLGLAIENRVGALSNWSGDFSLSINGVVQF